MSTADRPKESPAGLAREVVGVGKQLDSLLGDRVDDAMIEMEVILGRPGAVLDTVDPGRDCLSDSSCAVGVGGHGHVAVTGGGDYRSYHVEPAEGQMPRPLPSRPRSFVFVLAPLARRE